ncbi:MAG TPA: methyl-accepting chemotaxis protein [Rhodospirillaceae bacterium]|nr:methyl-accepting chemotaxis protein [Rhodospirillaceae bacterium]
MLDKLTIPGRLAGAFGTLLLLMVALAALSTLSQKSNDGTLTDVVRRYENSTSIQRALKDLAFSRGNIWMFVSTGNPALEASAAELSGKAHVRLKDLIANTKNPDRKAKATELEGLISDFEVKLGKVKALRGQGIDSPDGSETIAAAAAAFAKLNDQGSTLANEYLDAATAAKEAAVQDASTNIGLSIVVGLLSLVLGVGLAMAIARSIDRPLREMVGLVERLGRGETSVVVAGVERTDEFGPLAKALEQWRASLIAADQQREEERLRLVQREARARKMEALITSFDQGATGVVETVSGAATELETTAQTMMVTADHANAQANIVASAAEMASSSSQAVASAAEELSASINEISRQVSASSQSSKAAAEEAHHTNRMVQGLADSSSRIGEVVSLINDIAAQTNLLALNATIEAARAGDAGKGFAVVANEVKNLANQTAKATGEIGTQIGAVQSATREAVGAIEAIVNRIDEINQIAGAIAAAVEEQGAATAEIARNVQQAAQGAQEVSTTIVGVTTAAGETGSAAGEVLSAAQSLARETVTLKGMIEGFLTGVRGT